MSGFDVQPPALRPALEREGGTWVGWDGGASDVPKRVQDLELELRPVALSRREVDDYYHGFSNRTLWPLLHGLIEQPVFERRWWHAYRDVNERFAGAGADADADALHWVHDYHLMLAPSLLRRAGASGPIGFFLHVPFPPPEIFARLPSIPDRANSMNHMSRRQTIPPGDFRVAGFAAMQGAAFSQQLGSGRTMDRTIHATPAK